MNIANLNEMAKHELGVEYESNGFKWFNQQLSCGCISAICTSVEPKKEDTDYIIKIFTKNNTLSSIINETLKSSDEEIKNNINKFRNELEDVKNELRAFITKKKEEYKFPIGIDFNAEYYFLKLKQGPNCKSGN